MKAEGRGQRAEGRGQRAEGRGRRQFYFLSAEHNQKLNVAVDWEKRWHRLHADATYSTHDLILLITSVENGGIILALLIF
jgi:hypothetical protein